MTQLEYNDDNNSEFGNNNALNNISYRHDGIIGFMLDKGIVKSERSAQIVLIIIIVFCLASIVWMITDGLGINSTAPEKVTNLELQKLPQEAQDLIRAQQE